VTADALQPRDGADAALAVAHVIGWQMTKIDLPALVAGLPNATHIVASLANPDAFEPVRDDVSVEGQVTFLAPVAAPTAAAPAASTITADGDQTLVIITQYINLLQWRQAGTAIWLIAIVVTGFDYLSAWLREKIV
jgi:hypothetical protein